MDSHYYFIAFRLLKSIREKWLSATLSELDISQDSTQKWREGLGLTWLFPSVSQAFCKYTGYPQLSVSTRSVYTSDYFRCCLCTTSIHRQNLLEGKRKIRGGRIWDFMWKEFCIQIPLKINSVHLNALWSLWIWPLVHTKIMLQVRLQASCLFQTSAKALHNYH